MPLRLLLAVAVAAIPVPALAQSLNETHREVWLPAGKTVKLYAPIKRDACATVARHQPAGKLSHHGAADADPACDVIAARDTDRAKQAGE